MPWVSTLNRNPGVATTMTVMSLFQVQNTWRRRELKFERSICSAKLNINMDGTKVVITTVVFRWWCCGLSRSQYWTVLDDPQQTRHKRATNKYLLKFIVYTSSVLEGHRWSRGLQFVLNSHLTPFLALCDSLHCPLECPDGVELWLQELWLDCKDRWQYTH